MSTHPLAKRVFLRSGFAGALHRARNRRTLTVVAFHRVLDPADPRWSEADPEWTVSRALFGDCLDFFRRHWRVLGLPQLQAAARRPERLPDRSLLVTLDDGWADSAEHALPELARRGMPAVVFVAARAVGRRAAFWREALAAALRGGRLDAGEHARITAELEAAPAELRDERALSLPQLVPPAGPALMLTGASLRALAAGGVYVGSHGSSHEPLDQCARPAHELEDSRRALGHLLEGAQEPPRAFSFPHGRHDPALVALARSAGYELLFTSEPCLNRLPERGAPHLLGRISIDGRQISGPDGRLRSELLATWLFLRPIVGLWGSQARGLE